MKKTTCANLRGACDAVIMGSTPQEMGEHCKEHVMQMIQQGDTPHQDAVAKMQQTSKEEFNAWHERFEKEFDSLPDA